MCAEWAEKRVPSDFECPVEELTPETGSAGRWEMAVDRYLKIVEEAYAVPGLIERKVTAFSRAHPVSGPDSRVVIRVTLAALFVVFAIVLCSCAHRGPRELPLPHVREPIRGPDKERGQLFLKKEEIVVRPRERGSRTGSIWADTRPPRDLYSEVRPGRSGEVITVAIPEDLRFTPPTVSSAKKSEAPGGPKGSDAAGAASQSGENEGASLTDPFSVGPSSTLVGEALKEFRMEIVATEPTGDVFLRGLRDFRSSSGEQRTVAIMAKVPKRSLTGYTIDARELTAVTVNESRDGNGSDYATTGWDKVVSRKLAGFVPDIDAELTALEGVRQELQASQQAVREAQKANRDERARLVKERERAQGAAEAMRQRSAANAPKDAPKDEPQPAEKAQAAPGGTK